MMPTFVIARLTFLEAVRRRIVLAAFLLGLSFLVLYGAGFYFTRQEATPLNPDSTGLRRAAEAGLVTSYHAGCTP